MEIKILTFRVYSEVTFIHIFQLADMPTIPIYIISPFDPPAMANNDRIQAVDSVRY